MSRMPTKKRLESATKDDINDLLDKHGWFWWSGKADMFGKSGISDKMAFRHGILMAIEAKRGTKKPTPTALQIGFLNSIRANNGFGFVVNDARLPHLAAFLEAFDRAQSAKSKGEKVVDEDGSIMLNAIAEMTTEL